MKSGIPVVLSAAAFGAALSLNAATTVWYRFDGTPGDTSFGTTVENAASPGTRDGTITRYNLTTPTDSAKAAYAGTYSPHAIKAGGVAFPNTSSLYLGPADTYRERTDLALRAYGGFIRTTGDEAIRSASFTAEFVYRIDHETTQTSAQGLRRYLINCCGGYTLSRLGLNWTLKIGTNDALLFVGGTDGDVAPGLWHHLAITYDGSTKNVSVWVDYVCVLEPTTLANGLEYGKLKGEASTPPSDLIVGNGTHATGGYCFAGWWDEFRLSDAALSPGDFLDVRERLLPPGDPETTLYRYRFGDTNNACARQAADGCGWAPATNLDWCCLNFADWRSATLTFKDFTTVLSQTIPTNSVFNPTCCGALAADAGTPNEVAGVLQGNPKNWYSTSIPVGSIVDGDFTAECIFLNESTVGTVLLQRPTGSGGVTWGLSLNSDAGMIFEYNGDSTAQSVPFGGVGSKTFSTPAWHHVAVVYDHATHAVELWLDYTLRTTETLPEALRATGNELEMGLRGSGAAHFKGLIDEVRIVRGKLASSQFLTYPNRGQLGDWNLGFWRFEGGITNTFLADGLETHSTGAPVFTNDVRRAQVYGKLPVTAADHVGTNASALVCDASWVDRAASGLYVGEKFEPRAFTFEFFYRPDSFSSANTDDRRYLVTYLNAANNNLPVWAIAEMKKDRALYAFFRSNRSDKSGDHLPAGAALDATRWHHVALTVREFEHSAGVTNISAALYVDYRRYAQWQGAGSTGVLAYPIMYGSDGGTLRLGGTHHTQGLEKDLSLGYDGLLDEVRLTGRVLEPSEFLRQRDGKGFVLFVR